MSEDIIKIHSSEVLYFSNKKFHLVTSPSTWNLAGCAK